MVQVHSFLPRINGVKRLFFCCNTHLWQRSCVRNSLIIKSIHSYHKIRGNPCFEHFFNCWGAFKNVLFFIKFFASPKTCFFCAFWLFLTFFWGKFGVLKLIIFYLKVAKLQQFWAFGLLLFLILQIWMSKNKISLKILKLNVPKFKIKYFLLKN